MSGWRKKRKKSRSIFEEVNALLEEALKNEVKEAQILSALRQCLGDLYRKSLDRIPQVFLSYASQDKRIVRGFSEGLERHGINTWFDEKQLAFGESIIDTISNALDRSDFLAFFISGASAKSKWAHQELSIVMAQRLGRKGGGVVLPVLLEDVEIPPILRDVKYLDLRDGNIERGVLEMVSAIRHHLSR